MPIRNKTYDALKYVAIIALPALATFWIGLASLWGLPLQTEIAGTITLADTFLGTLLLISTAQYKKDDLQE